MNLHKNNNCCAAHYVSDGMIVDKILLCGKKSTHFSEESEIIAEKNYHLNFL